jgi:hypothetical protein
MVMCQDYDLLASLKVTQTEFHPPEAGGGGDASARRQLWNRWAAELHEMDEDIKSRKM